MCCSQHLALCLTQSGCINFSAPTLCKNRIVLRTRSLGLPVPMVGIKDILRLEIRANHRGLGSEEVKRPNWRLDTRTGCLQVGLSSGAAGMGEGANA